jgi:hemerythrin-like domain-containing protein
MLKAAPQESTMPHISLQTIREEHATLGAMLSAMRKMVVRGPANNPQHYFDVLRAILFYIDEFPHRLHHTKESKLLFPVVLKALPELAGDIERLNRDHETGQQAVHELQHALLAWELLGEPRMPEFVEQAEKYLDFHQAHMHLEEAVILVQTEKALNAAQWKELDAAFVENRDPYLGRYPPDPAYDRLFTRILMRANAPPAISEDC